MANTMKYWFNGLPFEGVEIAANASGTCKFWFNGLPAEHVIPTAGGGGVSASVSPSISASISASVSASASPSPSVSPSVSPSPSVSSSTSASISSSLSASVSPSVSPSEGYQGYTRGDENILPLDDNDLETGYSAQDLLDVAEVDASSVCQTATQEYMIHMFKDYVGTNTKCKLNWKGQTTLEPSSSTVHLQIFDRIGTKWDDVDTDNTSDPDVDFILEGNVEDLTNYKDDNNVISCRVYQEAL